MRKGSKAYGIPLFHIGPGNGRVHHIPCEDVTLTGLNFELDNKLTDEAGDTITARVYVPLGIKTTPGQVVEGEFWCHGAFYRTEPDGTNPERIAWGLRSLSRQQLLGDSDHPHEPLVRLPVHAAAEGMVFGREEFGMDPKKEILVADFGAIIPYYKESDLYGSK